VVSWWPWKGRHTEHAEKSEGAPELLHRVHKLVLRDLARAVRVEREEDGRHRARALQLGAQRCHQLLHLRHRSPLVPRGARALARCRFGLAFGRALLCRQARRRALGSLRLGGAVRDPR
jgi:hypothetical protein